MSEYSDNEWDYPKKASDLRTCLIRGQLLKPMPGPNSQELDPGTQENKANSAPALPKKSVPCSFNAFKNITYRVRKSYPSDPLMLYKIPQSNRKVLQRGFI